MFPVLQDWDRLERFELVDMSQDLVVAGKRHWSVAALDIRDVGLVTELELAMEVHIEVAGKLEDLLAAAAVAGD